VSTAALRFLSWEKSNDNPRATNRDQSSEFLRGLWSRRTLWRLAELRLQQSLYHPGRDLARMWRLLAHVRAI